MSRTPYHQEEAWQLIRAGGGAQASGSAGGQRPGLSPTLSPSPEGPVSRPAPTGSPAQEEADVRGGAAAASATAQPGCDGEALETSSCLAHSLKEATELTRLELLLQPGRRIPGQTAATAGPRRAHTHLWAT